MYLIFGRRQRSDFSIGFYCLFLGSFLFHLRTLKHFCLMYWIWFCIYFNGSCSERVSYSLDSPGVPPSATAHELFRGFSYVAPALIDDILAEKQVVKNAKAISSVSLIVFHISVASMRAVTFFWFRTAMLAVLHFMLARKVYCTASIQFSGLYKCLM